MSVTKKTVAFAFQQNVAALIDGVVVCASRQLLYVCIKIRRNENPGRERDKQLILLEINYLNIKF